MPRVNTARCNDRVASAVADDRGSQHWQDTTVVQRCLLVLAFVLAGCGGTPQPGYPPPRLLGPGEDPGGDLSANPAFDYSSSSDDEGCGPSCPANRGEGNGCVQGGEGYHGCGTPKSGGGGRFRRGAGGGLPILVAIAIAVRRRRYGSH